MIERLPRYLSYIILPLNISKSPSPFAEYFHEPVQDKSNSKTVFASLCWVLFAIAHNVCHVPFVRLYFTGSRSVGFYRAGCAAAARVSAGVGPAMRLLMNDLLRKEMMIMGIHEGILENPQVTYA